MANAIAEQEIEAKRSAAVVCLAKLPPYRPSALKLLNISSDMEAPVTEFEQAFKADPALTADLLLVANSVEFGLRAQVSTIRHAITYLGLERVRSLASTIAFSYYVRNVPPADYLKGVWAHSVATASIAERIGNACGVPGLYTAGLMHDIGRLGLLLYDAPHYQAALQQKFVNLHEAAIVEKTLVGMTHCEAGETLAKTWQLPDSLRSCITGHHEDRDDSATAVNIVRAACGLADFLGYPEVDREDLDMAPALPDRFQNRPELQPDRLREQVTKAMGSFGW